ncbi:MAG TPA: aminoacyl-tRNA deacylase [Candidatus Pullichristensenella avicola]|nr:aminoacyl-tRNA deacylase [Candidatus Pullichristensenella avicola]
MREKHEKTNAMRALDRVKARYAVHSYGSGEAVSGVEVARMLGQDERRVFKTLVTEGKSGAHYAFMVPAAEELDLKKAAACVGEKSLSMLRSKELLPLTGYVHGGCSPIGMKKPLRTVAHETAKDFDAIFFSAGKIGLQIEASLETLRMAVPVELADVVAQR